MITTRLESTDRGMKLSGHLTFHEVSLLKKEGINLLQSLSYCKVDCCELEVANTASLVLFLSWVRYAKKHGKTLIFSGFSEKMRLMTSLYSLDTILLFE